MPTDAINDQSIPENLAWFLKIYADAWLEITNSRQPLELRASQTELLFKLLIAHVTCEGLSSSNYE